MPHQTPTYFCGVIHDVSAIFEGSFRLRISAELIRSTARRPICTVRHGVVNVAGT